MDRIAAPFVRSFLFPSIQLLECSYPGLLYGEFPRQLVEVYVPFPFEGESEGAMSPDGGVGEGGEGGGGGKWVIGGGEGEEGDGEMGEGVRREEEGEVLDLEMNGEETGVRGRGEREANDDDVFLTEDSLHTKSDLKKVERWTGGERGREGGISVGNLGCVGRGGGGGGEEDGGKGSRLGGLPVVGSLPSFTSSPGSSRQRLLVEQNMSSWEVLSKQSSTSTRFSIKTVSNDVIMMSL